ncbi:hypothetical protein ACLOJK_011707 [Asimina triloba]
MDRAELTTEQVLKRDIPWETYMTTKLITGTCLQLLRRYDKRSESYRAQLLDDDGPAYIRVFVSILRDIMKEETVEYVLALIDEMLTVSFVSLTANPKRARLFHDESLANEDTYEPFLTEDAFTSYPWYPNCNQLPGNVAEGTICQIIIRSSRWHQVARSADLSRVHSAIYPAVEYLATTRTLRCLIDVVKGSTKEKVVRVIVLTLKNLLTKGTFGAHMVDLGLPQIVQSLKAQAWSDEDLLDALNQLEEGLKDNIKRLSSFDKYKQEVLLGHLDWSPMHKDPMFWRDNVTNFEESDYQILRVLITILETSSDPRTLAVACYDLSQFIQYHPAGRGIVNDLKTKDKVMKLINHENAEVTKNALLCVQRLFLGTKKSGMIMSVGRTNADRPDRIV